MILFGTNPIAWANDDDRSIGADIPTERILDEAGRQIGFDGIENGHRWPDDPEELRALLAGYGLKFIGGWYSTNLLVQSVEDEIAASQAHLARLRHNGCKVFITCETSNAIHGDRGKPLSQRPVMAPGDWADFGRRITEVAERTLAEGVRLVYHHHMGTIVESEADIDAFRAATGEAAHLLLDTGHATWGGADPVRLAGRYRTRISHVHAKDVRKAVMEQARAEDWSFLDAILGKGADLGVYTVPGDGMVDYPAVFKALPGYSGWVVVEAEQDPEKAHPLTYAKKGVAHLEASLKEAGLV